MLDLLRQGVRNSEIAERLIISHKAVDRHVFAILSELRVRTRCEAAAQADRFELIGH